MGNEPAIIASYTKLLTRFRTFKAGSKELQEQKKLQTRLKLAELKGSFTQAKKQQVREALRAAPQFNLFRVLGISHLEMRTHSAFLAHLLDPEGSHGQQFLFLESFLSLCRSKTNLPAGEPFPHPGENIRQHDWQIVCEQSTPYGRMDIVITCPDLGYLYVVENKVGASEQPGQLASYGHWMAEQRDEYDEQALIFLTPAGRKSHTHGPYTYFRLSYYTDIVNWLAHAAPTIHPGNVKTALTQYLQLWKL